MKLANFINSLDVTTVSVKPTLVGNSGKNYLLFHFFLLSTVQTKKNDQLISFVNTLFFGTVLLKFRCRRFKTTSGLGLSP